MKEPGTVSGKIFVAVIVLGLAFGIWLFWPSERRTYKIPDSKPASSKPKSLLELQPAKPAPEEPPAEPGHDGRRN